MRFCARLRTFDGTARCSTDDDLAASDDELAAADKDDAVLRPRKTRRSQNGEFIVRGYELIVRAYEVVVSGVIGCGFSTETYGAVAVRAQSFHFTLRCSSCMRP